MAWVWGQGATGHTGPAASRLDRGAVVPSGCGLRRVRGMTPRSSAFPRLGSVRGAERSDPDDPARRSSRIFPPIVVRPTARVARNSPRRVVKVQRPPMMKVPAAPTFSAPRCATHASHEDDQRHLMPPRRRPRPESPSTRSDDSGSRRRSSNPRKNRSRRKVRPAAR